MNSRLFNSSSVVTVEFSRYAAQQTGDQDLDDAARTLILKAVGISGSDSLAGHDFGLDATKRSILLCSSVSPCGRQSADRRARAMAGD